jgi:Protein of unknown function (DUF707)
MLTKKKNLVVVRAGDKSLHPQWIDSRLRNWDIAISYFGDYPERYKEQYDYLHICKGSKWQGLTDFVKNEIDLIDQYEYIWFPDDDLFTSCEVINNFFNLCHQNDLVVAQPALTQYSYYSWDITLEDVNCDYRLTDFVEIMAPCFKKSTFHLFKDTFAINTSGWGLEWLWCDIAQKNGVLNFGIIDKTPVFHTRKVGAAAHGGTSGSPQHEFNTLMQQFNLKYTPPKVLHFFLRGSGHES